MKKLIIQMISVLLIMSIFMTSMGARAEEQGKVVDTSEMPSFVITDKLPAPGVIEDIKSPVMPVFVETARFAVYNFQPETGVKGLSKLKKKINTELKGQTGIWSVYVKNLDTNQYMLINNKQLPSASLIKLYIMMSAYDLSSKKKLPEDALFNSRMDSMITVSDNYAANQITQSLAGGSFKAGAKKVNAYCKKNGYTKTKFVDQMGLSSPKNVTSAKDCGWALERMYRGIAVNSNDSAKMISLLKGQTRRWKIPAGVPSGVTVANKTGETAIAENDAAIVYSKGADYVIVVMSKNGTNAIQEIQNISRITYNYFN